MEIFTIELEEGETVDYQVNVCVRKAPFGARINCEVSIEDADSVVLTSATLTDVNDGDLSSPINPYYECASLTYATTA